MGQYRAGLVNYWDISEAKFWDFFLKPADHLGMYLYPNEKNAPPPAPENILKSTICFNDFDRTPPWAADQHLTDDYHYSGEKSAVVNADNHFSPGITKTFSELGTGKKHVLQVNVMVFPEARGGDAVLVYTYSGDKGNYVWRGIHIDPRCKTAGEWNRIEVVADLPPPGDLGDKLSVYIYQVNGSPLYIDDFRIEVDEVK
jgi:hypothetical protein